MRVPERVVYHPVWGQSWGQIRAPILVAPITAEWPWVKQLTALCLSLFLENSSALFTVFLNLEKEALCGTSGTWLLLRVTDQSP